MKTVRVWFRKTGAACYISHLDLTHCMARALHRSKIPLWYTQGFNPRAHMVFALPLPLGMAGERESVDIKIEEDKISMEEVAQRLSRALPPTLPVTAVTEPVMKPGRIAFASYELRLEPEGETADELAAAFAALLEQPEIPVEKHTKSGMAHFDLKPHLGELSWSAGEGGLLLSMVLPAGSEKNISPFLLTEALEKQRGVSFLCRAVRNNLYDAERKIFE